MTIKNNLSATNTLNTLKRNDTALGKAIKRISAGEAITGAGDDASGFSISETMRVRIRALDQDE